MKTRLLLFLISLSATHIVVAQSFTINKGSGSFSIDGGGRHQADAITVYYHMPENFTQSSRVLLVIPGAGRNGDDYRDAWIEASEKYSVLIVSPAYPEEAYDYGDYHLGGMVKDLNLTKGVSFKEGTNQVHIDEGLVEFKVNENKGDWIFSDFDRLFKLVKKATKSNQRTYHMFGHSAGGQILHRLVLFHPKSKADMILASNGGTYTFPDDRTDYPFGVKNVGISRAALKKSFKNKLVLFLGALDNDSETRGRMLRSPTADRQGTNRLERAENYYAFSQDFSEKSGVKFNWELEIVPNVGHDQKKMAEAAAAYLYGQE